VARECDLAILNAGHGATADPATFERHRDAARRFAEKYRGMEETAQVQRMVARVEELMQNMRAGEKERGRQGDKGGRCLRGSPCEAGARRAVDVHADLDGFWRTQASRWQGEITRRRSRPR
jgi:hypothetical protein